MSSIRTNPPPYSDRSISNHWGQDGRVDNERESLLNYGSVTAPLQRKPSISITKLFIIFTIVLMGLSASTIFYPYLNKESIRREWDAEGRRYQVMRNAWNSDRKAMAVERETWQKERVDQRNAMAMDRERWKKEHADQRKAMAVEREAWQKEQASHRLEREALAAEKEEWRKERADHVNRERQEEEAKRALIVWQDLKPSSRCLRYGTREYSATLAQVSPGLDPLKECWNKSIDIHGQQLLPSRCETQGMCGAVVGHWIVNFKEAVCVTWWAGYDDKGCVERGIHRYESILINLQNGDDWHEMCATTPGRVQGRNYDGPTSCASWRSGINAIWLVEDGNCY